MFGWLNRDTAEVGETLQYLWVPAFKKVGLNDGKVMNQCAQMPLSAFHRALRSPREQNSRAGARNLPVRLTDSFSHLQAMQQVTE